MNSFFNLKEEKEEDDGYHYAEKKTIKKLFFSGEDIHWDMYYYYLKPEEVKKIARMIINLTKNDFEEVFGLCFLKCRELPLGYKIRERWLAIWQIITIFVP